MNATKPTTEPAHEDGVQVLCAGCLEWFAVAELKTHHGHPYCVACFPKGAR